MKKNFTKVISTILAISIILSTVVLSAYAETDLNYETAAYTGEEITPIVSLYDAGTALVDGTDYDLSYKNNVNVGTATVTITFKGNYTGTREVNFNIIARKLSDSDITFSTIDKQTYTGSEITPTPTIKCGDVTLEKDKDYTLSYKNNINVGTATVNVTFIGNYEGKASTTFEIIADVLSTEKVSFSKIDNQTYTGREIKPEPTITYGPVTLEKGKDYTLSYDNNVNVGTATVTVAFMGNYAGNASTTFEIVAKSADESNVTISAIPDQTYTGSEITPKPTVKDITR